MNIFIQHIMDKSNKGLWFGQYCMNIIVFAIKDERAIFSYFFVSNHQLIKHSND